MSALERLAHTPYPVKPGRRAPNTAHLAHSIDLEAGIAEFVAPADARRDDFDVLLREKFPQIPDVSILEVTALRAWDAGGKLAQHVTCKIAVGGETSASRLDLERLGSELRRLKPRKRVTDGDRTMVELVADWQLGLRTDWRGGWQSIAQRVVDSIGATQDRARELRKLKRPAGHLVLAGMGDPIEGARCDNYPAQMWSVDLHNEDQRALYRRLRAQQIRELAPFFDRLTAFEVASNHAQQGRRGKDQLTDPSDDVGLGVMRSLAEAFAENDEAFGHIEFVHSPDPLVTLLDLHGIGVAFHHGHVSGRGANPVAKVWDWWSGQAMGMLAAGEASILCTAHYHHEWSMSQSGRKIIGAPALTPGSQYLTDARGLWSDAGVYTFVVDEGGFSDPQTLVVS